MMPDIKDIQVGDCLPERRHAPTNVSLFLYNAAIWNAHRIHYDAGYTTEVEKHPAIVVDGPLQGDGLTWWKIQDPNRAGREGWAASNYLQPVPSEPTP